MSERVLKIMGVVIAFIFLCVGIVSLVLLYSDTYGLQKSMLEYREAKEGCFNASNNCMKAREDCLNALYQNNRNTQEGQQR